MFDIRIVVAGIGKHIAVQVIAAVWTGIARFIHGPANASWWFDYKSVGVRINSNVACGGDSTITGPAHSAIRLVSPAIRSIIFARIDEDVAAQAVTAISIGLAGSTAGLANDALSAGDRSIDVDSHINIAPTVVATNIAGSICLRREGGGADNGGAAATIVGPNCSTFL